MSWLSIVWRQPVMIAYLLCGIIAGPYGLRLVGEVEFVRDISDLGIVLLLFLAGMELHPRRLKELAAKAAFVTVVSCLTSTLVLAWVCGLLGYDTKTSWLIASAMMFSSTILCIKLIPTTTLHQQRMGAFCIAILIFQDILAILALVLLSASDTMEFSAFMLLPVKTILVIAVALLGESFMLRPVMRKCESVTETLYLFPLGWCLAVAVLSYSMNLSAEIGAFLAGFAMTRSPISHFLVEKLKLLRDFFLLFFFFALGAMLNLFELPKLFLPALILCVVMMLVKGAAFFLSVYVTKESVRFSYQAGIRLSQASEFSMIMSLVALNAGVLSAESAHLIQVSTLLSFLLSSYLVTNLFRTPWTAPAEHSSSPA